MAENHPVIAELKRKRLALGLSVGRFARTAGLARNTVRQYENVKFSGFSFLVRWAGALGYDVVLKPRDPLMDTVPGAVWTPQQQKVRDAILNS